MYLASQVRKERGRVPFSRQFAIMRALEKGGAGSVVHSPVPTRQHRDWVAGTYDRWFVRSYTEHDGVPDWRSAPLVADAARKLALVHRASRTIDPAVLRVPRQALQVYDWAMFDVLGHIGPLIADMVARRRAPDHIEAVEAGLGRLNAQRVGLCLGPEGLTHHDLRTENLLTRDDRVIEIVDWDRAHWDVQWYDVTLAGLHLAYGDASALRWDLTDTFLDAYQAGTEYELAADALAWLFRFTAVRNLAVSRSPEKWARLLNGVEERWGDGSSVFVDDFVAEDQVALHPDVAAEDGGAVGAVGVG
jgi:Ser/Thr protein kinase RdoA (MazF antagonist)